MQAFRGRNISFTVGAKKILEELNFEFETSNTHCIVGKNGAGKSTFLKILTRNLALTQGELLTPQGLSTSFVPPEFNTSFHYSVEYFMVMELYRFHRGVPLPKHFEQCRQWLKSFLPELSPQAKLSQLSSGEKKIVLLARSFAAQPDIFILDEPSTHLDLFMLKKLKAFIAHNNKKTFVIVDHNQKFLEDVGKKFYLLEPNYFSEIKSLSSYINS